MAFASLKNGTHIDHQPFIIGVIPHHLQQLLPNAFIAPADKTPMRVAPVTQIRRQVTPGEPVRMTQNTALVNRRLSLATLPHAPWCPGKCGSSSRHVLSEISCLL